MALIQNSSLHNISWILIDELNVHKSPQLLKVHVKQVHLGIKQKQRIRKSFTCSECPEGFTTVSALIKHSDLVHNVQVPWPYNCDQCDWGGAKEAQLKEHVQKIHINGFKYKNIGMYICKECRERFHGPTLLKKHMWKVHRKKYDLKWPCSHCDKQFPMKQDMKNM